MRILRIIGRVLLWSLLVITIVITLLIGVVTYVILTPKHLTPLVRRVATEYLNCETHISRAELTIVSTFPYVGLEMDSVYLIRPMEGAQSDTLLAVPHLLLSLDAMKLIDGDLCLHTLHLEDAEANIYIAKDGTANYDILPADDEDDRDKDKTEEDDDEGGWKLRSIHWEDNLDAQIRHLTIRDRRDSLEGELRDLTLCIATDSTLSLTMSATVDPVRIDLNGTIRPLSLDPIRVALDVDVRTNSFMLSELMALVPDSLFTMPDSISADGLLQLEAHASGLYTPDTMPIVTARVQLSEGQGYHLGIPHRLHDIHARAEAYVDLNDTTACWARLDELHLRSGHSTIDLHGDAKDLFADMALHFGIRTHVVLPDFADMMPEDIHVAGVVDAHLPSYDLRLSELDTLIIPRDIEMDVRLHSLACTTDSMQADAETMAMHLTLSEGCSTELIRAKALIEMSDLHVDMAGGPKAELGQTTLNIHGEYNTQDTTVIPLFAGAFFTTELRAEMDTISTYLVAPKGGISLSSSRRDKSEPRLTATIAADSIWAKMGSQIEASTERLTMKASARHRSGKDNILLEWNPRVDFDVHRAVADVQGIPYTVYVPDIRFNYSNRDFTIDTSRIELGRSNFNLAGQVTNIGAYMENKGLLMGQLRFTSSYADVNQLLDLVNGFGNDPAELDVDAPDIPHDTLPGKLGQIKTAEANPFIVPKGVDLSIYTLIDSAYAFGETLRQVGGQVDCRDGVITLQQMGFTSQAAHLELTGIYETPRRNHLFAGFDFHMTDIHLAELVNMVPQVDSVLPMLRSFKGLAQVHLAAETYANAYYQIKPSTTRAALSIEAKDLTLLDGETFTKIAKALSFKKSRENKIDSISAEIGMYKNQVTVYPFLLHYGPWRVALGGEHNLSGHFKYHISALSPIYLGVNVESTTKRNGEDGLQIGVGKCLYKKDFTPTRTGLIDTQAMNIRRLIHDALKR